MPEPAPIPTQATAYDADTGQAIPESELGKALSEGRAAFSKGSRVHMVDSSGRHVSVEAGDVGAGIESGMSLMSSEGLAQRSAAKAKRAEEPGGFNPVDALVGYNEAFHRGVTGGLSDVALNAALGDDYSKRAAKRKEADSLSGVYEAGGMGGAIVAGALTGGATAGMSAGSRGALGALTAVPRMSAGAGRIAAGGLRGLGVTGESLLGQAGLRAAEFGAAGAVEGGFHAAGKYASDATLAGEKITAEKLASAAGSGALFGAATGGVLGGGGTLLGAGARKVLGGLSSGRPLQEAAADYAAKRSFKAVTGNARKFYDEAMQYGGEARVQRIGQRLLDDGVPIHNGRKAIQAVEGKLAETGDEMRAVAKSLDDMGVRVDAKQVLGTVDEQIKLIKETPFGTYKRVAKKLENEIAPLREAAESGKDYSITEFWTLRQQLDKTVSWNARAQNIATDELKTLRKHFSASLEGAIGQADEGAGKAWRASSEKYSDYKLVSEALEDLAKRTEKNRTVSASDYATGVATFLGGVASGGGAVLSMAQGAGVSALHKQLRERGPAYVAYAANALAKIETRQAAAVAAIADGSLVGKASNLAASAEAAKLSVREDFAKRKAVIDAFSQNPAVAMQRLQKGISGVAEADPQMGAELAQMAVGDAQYLASSMPTAMTRAGYSFTPAAETADRYEGTAVQRWLKRAEALDDPMSVVEDLARGNLNRDGIEALKERRPELFRELQVKVMGSLAESKTPIPYNRRVLLSLAFDFPGDRSLTPGYASSIQGAYQQAEAEAEEKAKGGNNGGSGGGPSKIVDSYKLERGV